MAKKRSWTREQLTKAVKNARSYRQVLIALNLAESGGNYSQLKKYISEYGIDNSHFKGRAWNKGMSFPFKPKISLSKILVKNSDFQSYKLKKRLIKEGLKKPYCEECGWSKKNSQRSPAPRIASH
jgi:hypothetical protein